MNIIDLNQDINFFYYGGSGGFFFLHYLLLMKKHHAVFKLSNFTQAHQVENYVPGGDYDANLRAIITYQWNVNKRWKLTEIWPDNKLTQETTLHHVHQVYYTCNQMDSWVGLPGQRVFLYTDIRSQAYLSMYKQAWVYRKTRGFKGILKTTRQLLENAVEFRGEMVYRDVPVAAQHADVVVRLQDLALYPDTVFGCSANHEQSQLLSTWINLHPDKLKNKVFNKEKSCHNVY